MGYFIVQVCHHHLNGFQVPDNLKVGKETNSYNNDEDPSLNCSSILFFKISEQFRTNKTLLYLKEQSLKLKLWLLGCLDPTSAIHLKGGGN